MSEAKIEPPKKRLRMTITIDGHDLRDLSRILDQIETDLLVGGREERQVFSGDGEWTLTVREPEMTREDYDRLLMEWWEAKQSAKASGREQPIEQEGS